MSPNGAKPLDDYRQVFRGRHLQLTKLRQNGQARHDLQQPLQSNHQTAGGRTNCINLIAPHVGGL